MQNLQPYSTYRSLVAKNQEHGFSEAEVKDILGQVLTQLAKWHDRKQAHGSISLDKLVYDDESQQVVLLAGNGINHPSYLAPEIRQTKRATPASDIYALAITAVVLLTDLPPEALKAANGKWNWENCCLISDRFVQILNVALLSDPDFRYIDAGQMLRSLQSPSAISQFVIGGQAIDSIPNPSDRFIPPLPPLPPPKFSAKDLHEALISDLESDGTYLSNPFNLPDSQTLERNHQVIPNLTGYKKQKSNQTKTRTLVSLLLGIGIPIAGFASGYLLIQPKFSQSAPIEDFKSANAIALLSDTTRTSIDQIEKSEKKMDKLLALAQDKYKITGNVKEVKTILQAVPSNSRVRPKADKLLVQYQQDVKKNEALIKKAEKAVNQGNWQVAIDTVKGVSSTPYWKKRGSKIAATAKQRLASAVFVPSPPLPVSSPYTPPLEPAYIPPQEVVVEPPSYYQPPERSYSAPERDYSPPPRSYSAPAPPPPRVAQ
jgi:hypothetical protein